MGDLHVNPSARNEEFESLSVPIASQRRNGKRMFKENDVNQNAASNHNVQQMCSMHLAIHNEQNEEERLNNIFLYE
jgi:hypothetical protein